MPDVRVVQGDTRPDLNATLTVTRTKEPLDLTGVASIRFQMRKGDDRAYTVDAEAVIVDAAAGTVRYTWGPNDLRTHGDYKCQWQLTYVEGGIQTTTPANSLEIRRQ